MALWNMPDLDLTFPGQSRSKLIVKKTSILSIISKFGRICQCYQVTALGNMLDLARLKIIFLFAWSNFAIHCLCLGSNFNNLISNSDWFPGLTIGGSDNSARPNVRGWNLMYDFLSITNSNSVVILNKFGDIGHWKPVWPGLTFQGHSR